MMGITNAPSLVHTPGVGHTRQGGKNRRKYMGRSQLYLKFNPNHDALGRFAAAAGGAVLGAALMHAFHRYSSSKPEYSKEEILAIRHWVGMGNEGSSFSRGLRDDLLQSAAEKGRGHPDFLLARGVNDDHFLRGRPTVGYHMLTEGRFTAGSVDPKIAHKFQHMDGAKGWMLLIHVPGSVGAIHVKDVLPNSTMSHEREVLLERNLVMRIEKISGKTIYASAQRREPIKKDLGVNSVHATTQLTMPRRRKPKLSIAYQKELSDINAVIYAKFNSNHDEKGRFAAGSGGGGGSGHKAGLLGRGTAHGAAHASALGGAVGATLGAYGGEALGGLAGPAAEIASPTLGSLGGSVGDHLGRKIGTAIYNRFYSPPQKETPDTIGGELGAGIGASLGVSAAKELISRTTPWEGKVAADIAAEVLGTAYGEIAGTRFGNFVSQRVGGVAGKMTEGIKSRALYEGAERATSGIVRAGAKLAKAKTVPPGGQKLQNDMNDTIQLADAPAGSRFARLLNDREDTARKAQIALERFRPSVKSVRNPSESFNGYRGRAASDASVKQPMPFPMAKRLFED